MNLLGLQSKIFIFVHSINFKPCFVVYFSADTLYDRPAEVFHTASIEEKHELITKLSTKYPVFKSL